MKAETPYRRAEPPLLSIAAVSTEPPSRALLLRLLLFNVRAAWQPKLGCLSKGHSSQM